MSLDILILAHRHDRLIEASKDREQGFTKKHASAQRYTISILAEIWHQRGLNVGIKRGPSRFSTAQAVAAINHVNLTVTPVPYLNYLRRFSSVVNGGFIDTSKSKYCRDLLSYGDNYDGPVIVKTDLNFGGKPERKLQRRAWPFRYLRLLGWSKAAASPDLDPYAYPIYDHASHVPIEVWRNPRLVIQKFQPERDNAGLYRLRSWYVCGDRGFHVATVAKEPIVKGLNTICRQVVDIVTPPEMETLRHEMCVDYGRFDYVLISGKPVVYDINRTPAITAASEAQYASQWRDLAEGIATFLN